MLDARNERDTEILAVSIDPAEDIQRMIDRISTDGRTPDFTFLSDPGHRVIDRYGLLNPQGRGGTIPHPTTLVIDKQGVVRWKFVEVNYRVRPTNQQILDALAVSIDDPGTEDRIRRFVREQGLTFEILHDPDVLIMNTWKVAGVPQRWTSLAFSGSSGFRGAAPLDPGHDSMVYLGIHGGVPPTAPPRRA